MYNQNTKYYMNYPKMILFEITTRCNLSCTYCSARSLLKTPSDLSIDKIEELVKKLEGFSHVCFSGLGEPFVHRNFYEVLGLFQGKKLIVVTNGSVPIDYERLMQFGNIDAISFSIDGGSESDMKRVCSSYRFDVLLKNLENSVKYNVNATINTTLIEENIESLDGLAELAREYKIKKLKIGFPLGKSKWLVKRADDIRGVLSTLKQEITGAGIEFEGPLAVKCIFDEAPIALMLKNGNIYPCCDYFCGRPLVGNVLNQDFETMWKKDSYHRFRSGKYCTKCSQYHNNAQIVPIFEKDEA